MKILIVDDEALARQRLRSMLEELGAQYLVVGEATNGVEALETCRDVDVDLVLMDIRMPVMGGIEAAALLARQDNPPAVIFVSAYEEHALHAFQGNALNYLLKPIRGYRLEKALHQVQIPTRPQIQLIREQQDQESDFICSGYRGGIRRIPARDIIFFRADQKYVTACHIEGEVLLEESLKTLEDRFTRRFLRIHRNALVSRRHLIGLEKHSDGRCLALLDGTDERLEISRRHLPEVRRLLKTGG
ncbi:MAG: response regulator transcription factor [Gammaproteobacteria bacterium]|nr:response regulator transcription factor [Gammaproteobacteria bacterium]